MSLDKDGNFHVSPFGPDPERRQRMVDAATAGLKKKYALDKPDEIAARANDIVTRIFGFVDQILKADDSLGGQYNEASMTATVSKLLEDEFHKWSNADKLHLILLIHTALMMDKINERVRMGLVGPDQDKPI